MVRAGGALNGFASEPDHQPGRQHHGDEEREHHGRRSIDGDGRHVGAHQTRDEQHWEQGGHDSQGRHDRGVSDLRNRLDGALQARPAVIHGPVPGDIFDHDDRIVDKDADGEDQREQTNPVDSISHQFGREESEENSRRDDDRGHPRLAPADRKADQDDNGHRGQRQVEQKLVRLLVGAFAIVTGDGDIHRRGYQRALQRLDPFQKRFANHNGVCATALGDGQTYCRGVAPGAVCLRIAPDPLLVLTWGLNHLGDVADIYGPAEEGWDRDQPDFTCALQALTRGDVDGGASMSKRPDRKAAPSLTHRVHQGADGDTSCGHARGIRFDPHLFWSTAHDEGQANIVDLGDLGAQSLRQIIERLIAPLTGGARLGR